jgi:glutamate dehydrogenase
MAAVPPLSLPAALTDAASLPVFDDETMNLVFSLVMEDDIYSHATLQKEVSHFFNGLQLPKSYFLRFTAGDMAKHVKQLIAAKHSASAIGDKEHVATSATSETSGFFISTIGCPEPTKAQTTIEAKVARFMGKWLESKCAVSSTLIVSGGPAFAHGDSRIGLYIVNRDTYRSKHVDEGESCLTLLSASRFEKEKSLLEEYQALMTDIVSSEQCVVRVIATNGHHLVLFGMTESAARHYFCEVLQALRFNALLPDQVCFDTFANGTRIFAISVTGVQDNQIWELERTLMYCLHMKNSARSEIIYKRVMDGTLSHKVAVYMMAAVRFVYTFFPRERYMQEYMDVRSSLGSDEGSQRMLDNIYQMCVKEILCRDRIYNILHQHLELAKEMFENFRCIATGQATPAYNKELAAKIDSSCKDRKECDILKMVLTFNEGVRITNFFKPKTPAAFAFRLDPAVVLRDRPTSMYPEMPYAIYMVVSRDFNGFHVRFRDIARGGLRMVLSRDSAAFERNSTTMFDECYNLALTQQYKNKDIPEGGSKGIMVLDPACAGASSQCLVARRLCFMRYLGSLLDCMLPEKYDIYAGLLPQGKGELLFFGPDENTAGYMDLGPVIAKNRGYQFYKAITTGKSPLLGGVPHDTYGMTTTSVHTYVTELLHALNVDETSITKFQTGGPDGDLGSNEILFSKDKTVGIVDGSGVLYDPAGLNREELTRLARLRMAVKEFSPKLLGKGGFLVKIEEANVTLPDGSQWLNGAELRDCFHLTDYAAADLFVPCGGRPNAVTMENVKKMFTADGSTPKFKYIVEGANLFFSDGARAVLEGAGVHLFKDSSTNKGGVTSSSLEVFSALALTPEEHGLLMSFDPANGEAPRFQQIYVEQILSSIVENAKLEYSAIWSASQTGKSKVDASKGLSVHINRVTDEMTTHLKAMPPTERSGFIGHVLERALPPVMIEKLGVVTIIARVPENYIHAIVSSWIASRYVYQYGLSSSSEPSFWLFMKSLFSNSSQHSRRKSCP